MRLLGIDLGGTKCAFRAVGGGGPERESAHRWPPGDDVAADLALLAGTAAGFGAESVGVAVPATLDARGRVVAWPGRPAWRGVDLGAHLAAALPGALVRTADDGDLATVAEADAAGGLDLLYLGVGTGVGGGLHLGGALLRSRNGPVAELGHLPVDPAGPRCACGRRGCLQAIAAGPATLARATAADPSVATAADLRSALARREPWAARVLGETVAALAAAIVAVAEVVRPAVVRVGGGFAAAIPELTPAVAAAVRALDRAGNPVPEVGPAVHGGRSSLVGAVLLAGEAPPVTSRARQTFARESP